MILAELIKEYVSGDWGNEEPNEDTPNEVFCIRAADFVSILSVDYTSIPTRYVGNNSFESKQLKVGDIVIEKSGGSPTQSTGRVIIVTEELLKEKPHIVCSNFCEAFRVKEGWNPFYVFSYLQFIYNEGVFFNFEGKTSGLKNLQMEQAFCSIDIPEQRCDISILSSIDKKVAINRKTNVALESLAKLIYDYWFVQFDFPNKDGKPYKSSGGKMVWNETLKREIPDGWHCGNLFEIATFTNGIACQRYRPSENETPLPVIKIREMHEGIKSDTEFVTQNIPESVRVQNGDVLFSWSASLEVMIWAYGEAGLNQHIFKVTSANGFPKSFYYFQLLNYVDFFRKIAEARKTTMGHITQDHLEQSTIAIPDSVDIANRFDDNVSIIFDSWVKLQEEISALQSFRDYLRPLLMNGQITIKD